jgi:hypothetical protein
MEIDAASVTRLKKKEGLRNNASFLFVFQHLFGAGNEIRTRDLHLGKVALYQLSYSRMTFIV